ncbi:RCC1 and BTB domain-containing protein 2 [Elysia marginata]|uniref:RCC1 and BTB domain-containing protein 2 n=1 Tax=Elysia marginata TaxID=1093978 RepID=A0AAV4IZE2_9GAST|nr:RCC1 and BTB domain-containing protein 2 [Elysia marginata]
MVRFLRAFQCSDVVRLRWLALGTGQLANTSEPTRLLMEPRPPNGVAVSGLACGSRHTMVLLTNGQVYAFGNNFYAQLGYDFRTETYKENQTSPGLLRYLMHHHVTQVACGDKHTLFLFQDGTVSAVGHNSRGQIGDGGRQESVVPKAVEMEVPVVSIACGRDHNLVLTDSGDVYVWGFCKGCGHRKNDVLSPELKLQGRQVVQLAGGATHSLALTRSVNVRLLQKFVYLWMIWPPLAIALFRTRHGLVVVCVDENINRAKKRKIVAGSPVLRYAYLIMLSKSSGNSCSVESCSEQSRVKFNDNLSSKSYSQKGTI